MMKKILIGVVFIVGRAKAFAQDDPNIDKHIITRNKIKQISEYIVRKDKGDKPDSLLFSKTDYDKNGNLVYYIKGEFRPDPNLSHWSYSYAVEYDKNGRVIKTTDSSNGVVSRYCFSTYNSKGLSVKSVAFDCQEKRTNTTLYTYNNKAQLIAKKYYVSDTVNSAKVTGKDTLGRLTSTLQYEYDNKGRITCDISTDFTDTSASKEITKYAYYKTSDGSKTISTFFRKGDSLHLQQVETDYDKHGNFIACFNLNPKNKLNSRRIYNSKNQLVEMVFESGSTVFPPGVSQNTANLDKGITTIHHNRVLYTYNAKGEQIEQLTYSDDVLINKQQWHYTHYDL